MTEQQKNTLKLITLSVIGILEETAAGMANGYGIYLIPAIEPFAVGKWGYYLIGGGGILNGTLQLLIETGCIATDTTQWLHISRVSLSNSLGAARLLSFMVKDRLPLTISSACVASALLSTQLGVHYLLNKPAGDQAKPSRCSKLSSSKCCTLFGKGAKGLAGGFTGAGAMYTTLWIYNNLTLPVNTIGSCIGISITAIANIPSQFSYENRVANTVAKLARHWFSAMILSCFMLVFSFNVEQDAHHGDDDIKDYQAILYSVLCFVLLGGLITGMRFVRDVPEEQRILILPDHEPSTNTESRLDNASNTNNTDEKETETLLSTNNDTSKICIN